MDDDLPEVEFKMAWQTYRVGERIRPPASLRDWLLANGYVNRLDERPAKLSARAAAKLAETKKLFT